MSALAADGPFDPLSLDPPSFPAASQADCAGPFVHVTLEFSQPNLLHFKMLPSGNLRCPSVDIEAAKAHLNPAAWCSSNKQF
jgi:hypothetical protein